MIRLSLFLFLNALSILSRGQCFEEVSKLIKPAGKAAFCEPVSASETAVRLSLINRTNCKNAQLFTVEKSLENGAAFYKVYAGKTEPIYSGKSYDGLMNSLNTHYKPVRNDVYLDLVNFGSKEEANIKSTCAVRLFENNKEVKINTLNRKYIPVNLQNDFFYKISSVSNIEVGEIVMKETAAHKKYYSSKISFFKGQKKMVFEVFADLKAAVRDCLNQFKSKLSNLSSKPSSLADIVSGVKSSIFKKHAISNKELIINFKNELSKSMLVKLMKIFTHSPEDRPENYEMC